MDLVIESRTQGAWAILDVTGEVDVFTAPKLRERIVQSIDQGHEKLIVNLDGVGFMDSTGLGTLVGGLKRMKERGGTLALVCSNRPVLRILTITGLDAVFSIHESTDKALAG
ncbi:MAG: anti-sigma factor antagonist BldG [Actinomycetota bacterium]